MQHSSLNRLAVRLGFWSSLLIAASFLVFTVSFITIAMNPPLFRWTDLSAYVTFFNSTDQFWQNLARAMMVLFAPLFVILLYSVQEYASGDRKFLANVAVGFGMGFAVLVSINYFVQLTAVRFNMAGEVEAGFEQFLQANPLSILSSINLLGWTVFFSLASLFIAPVFYGSRLERLIFIAFLLNGLMCLLGGLGYVLQNEGLVAFTLNFGMGGAVFVASIALCVLFRRLERGQMQATRS